MCTLLSSQAFAGSLTCLHSISTSEFWKDFHHTMVLLIIHCKLTWPGYCAASGACETTRARRLQHEMHYQSDCRTYIKRDWEEAKGGKLVLHSGWEEMLDHILSLTACISVLWHLGHHGEFKEDECEIADTYTILQRNIHSLLIIIMNIHNFKHGDHTVKVHTNWRCTQNEGAHKMHATPIVQIHFTQVTKYHQMPTAIP